MIHVFHMLFFLVSENTSVKSASFLIASMPHADDEFTPTVDHINHLNLVGSAM